MLLGFNDLGPAENVEAGERRTSKEQRLLKGLFGRSDLHENHKVKQLIGYIDLRMFALDLTQPHEKMATDSSGVRNMVEMAGRPHVGSKQLTIISGSGILTFVSMISQLLALRKSICKRSTSSDSPANDFTAQTDDPNSTQRRMHNR